MAEEQVQGAVGASLLAAGNVLHVCHLAPLEGDAARHDAPLVPHDVETDVLGEVLHEHLHLLHRVGGGGIVVGLQHMLQQLPVLMQGLCVALRHAVDVEAVLHSLLRLPDAQGAHLHRVPHRDAGAHQPVRELCAGTEEGIEVFARRDTTIYIRYRLVDEALGPHHVAIVAEDGLHHVEHLLLRHLGQHQQSAVGEPLVGVDGALLLVPVGRQHGHQVLRRQALLLEVTVGRDAGVDKQRAVEEAVGVVVHEATLEEEGAVLRHLHERIPRLPAINGIWYDGHCVFTVCCRLPALRQHTGGQARSPVLYFFYRPSRALNSS